MFINSYTYNNKKTHYIKTVTADAHRAALSREHPS